MTHHSSCFARRLTFQAFGCLAILAILSWPVAAPAQSANRHQGGVVPKTSSKFLAPFREVVSRASQSTVRVRCDGKDVALGTVVGADGWILTKASELRDSPVVRLKDGRELDARVVGVHEAHDIALLKVEAQGLQQVEWRPSKEAVVGTWVASAGTAEDPVAVGVVSVATRKLPTPKGVMTFSSSGYLGISLEPTEKVAKISFVFPNGGAAKAGLQVNDMIVAVAGKAIADAEMLVKTLQSHKPGDVIEVKVKRGEAEMDVKAKLGARPQSRGEMQNNLGSELSKRRGGFPTILQHDSVLRPADCGGPLVDLDGKVIGINVSRAGRTESYAVPTEVLLPLLAELKSGSLAPPTTPQSAAR